MTSGRIRERANRRGRERFRAGARAPRRLFVAARPASMRVRLFQRPEKTDRSRHRPQPTCEELTDLLRQKAGLLAQRLRLLWRHFAQKSPHKWLISSQDCSWLEWSADRFLARTHNGQWRRDIDPCDAEHWPDHDEPLRNLGTSRDTSRIEQSPRRSFPFSKRRRQCCDKCSSALLNGKGTVAARFRSKPRLHLNRLSVKVRSRDYFGWASGWDFFPRPSSSLSRHHGTLRCVSMLKPPVCPKARPLTRNRWLG